jgi:hypothetical protein
VRRAALCLVHWSDLRDSTGSAGLIQTISLFAGHHWIAAIFALLATVGWALQGLGNAFYYRSVGTCV